MDTAINHKEMRMDNGSDFLVDDFFDICVPVLMRTINADGQQFAGGLYISLYISLQFCMSEVNLIVLPYYLVF
jgi:hypothetical protein